MTTRFRFARGRVSCGAVGKNMMGAVLSVLLAALAFASSAAAGLPDESLNVKLTAPIRTWDEAVPLGNGLLGGLVGPCLRFFAPCLGLGRPALGGLQPGREHGARLLRVGRDSDGIRRFLTQPIDFK